MSTASVTRKVAPGCATSPPFGARMTSLIGCSRCVGLSPFATLRVDFAKAWLFAFEMVPFAPLRATRTASNRLRIARRESERARIILALHRRDECVDRDRTRLLFLPRATHVHRHRPLLRLLRADDQ